mmetsp:Transcript_16313/g.21353  ORF Transcript_16313/g.21353 Transcript_16313/m.21353 type:complete len:200 (+) Transcript_16313:185-784(+)|eukprot:CAMPEP_0198151462 /NCGR_PEP_ID=MMETSP1443-20131203/55622_1 /TAXON_ID=186043 /ORGANISM="Entomoneis sp., Strain CCMP2396" /LENGTH=199 /DNA_ID=CAMNT_0043817131 /DNA_START=143 /DNA_END=742 /DNA_ORIENTATION=-
MEDESSSSNDKHISSSVHIGSEGEDNRGVTSPLKKQQFFDTAYAAFLLYYDEHFKRIREENPDGSYAQCSRILAEEYKHLDHKDIREWKKMANRTNFNLKISCKADGDESQLDGRKKRRKKDPNAPKRSLTAYFHYSIHVRSEVTKANPGFAFGDVTKAISDQFKTLPPGEKKIWDDKAAADKERYLREMEEYTKSHQA